MSRPMRLQYPGAVYHVTARGNERRAIYRSDEDREYFVEILGKVPVDEHFGLTDSTVTPVAKDVERRRTADSAWERAITQVERCLPPNPKT